MADDQADDCSNTTAKSIGRGMIGFADAYDVLKPDILIILGDRYEMLAAASTALIYRIPIAHLHGGEITEGAFDDSIRHSITKMSLLHFTSTEAYRKRVIQLGEQPDRVFNVGALGVENILSTPVMAKEDLEKELDFRIPEKTLLVTYHPVTLSEMSTKEQIDNLIAALDAYKDTGSQVIINRINEYTASNSGRCLFVKSLGQKRYYSALRYVKAVVGNSSSGIIEVPSFGIPTLDIGDRQKGRIAADSVFHCGCSVSEIKDGLQKVLGYTSKAINNPYAKTGTCKSILEVLKSYPLDNIIQKRFYDIQNG